jgi:hypothetical protein
MKIYSLHTITDGKWSVKLTIRENDDFQHKYESRPDLRHLVDTHYNEEPQQLAKLILDNVLACEAVEVNLLCGPGIYMVRK